MARRIQTLTLPGPAGRLEALLEEPEHSEPRRTALVCHPHPQFGGTMHNKVVHRIARALRHTGHAVLRFNFRGVNLSEGSYAHGVGELDDARYCLNWLKDRYPGLPFVLAGFSFGSRIALRLACEHRPDMVIAVGYPAGGGELLDLTGCDGPKFFVQSTKDQFGSVEQLQQFVKSIPGPSEIRLIEATDHFFSGSLDSLEEAIASLGGSN